LNSEPQNIELQNNEGWYSVFDIRFFLRLAPCRAKVSLSIKLDHSVASGDAEPLNPWTFKPLNL